MSPPTPSIGLGFANEVGVAFGTSHAVCDGNKFLVVGAVGAPLAGVTCVTYIKPTSPAVIVVVVPAAGADALCVIIILAAFLRWAAMVAFAFACFVEFGHHGL